jgi:hypothetical protein
MSGEPAAPTEIAPARQPMATIWSQPRNLMVSGPFFVSFDLFVAFVPL